MGLFSKKVPERKWIDVAPALGLTLKASGNEFCPIFLSHTAIRGLAPRLSEVGRHYIAMLQLSAAASTIYENAYVSDPMFFLEVTYIAMAGRRPAQMHADIAEYQFCKPTQMPADPRSSLNAWASAMVRELAPENDDPALATELAAYGAWLVVRAKIATCEACGDRKGAEKVRRAVI